jgi:hypothetical protein
MYLNIAGKDRSADVGATLARQAARHQGALSPWSPRDSALSLKESRNAADYLERFCRLMRLRYSLSTESFPIPARPGTAGTLLVKVKGVLWKLLRYQHDRMAFQQNSINELVISSIDFQQANAQRKLDNLEQRIRALEAELAGLRKGGS